MKKLLLLLILSFFSAQGYAASCPDGSEPEKTDSADGTYFLYECGIDSNDDDAKIMIYDADFSQPALDNDNYGWISWFGEQDDASYFLVFDNWNNSRHEIGRASCRERV